MSASSLTAPLRLLVLGFLGIAVIGCGEVSQGAGTTAPAASVAASTPAAGNAPGAATPSAAPTATPAVAGAALPDAHLSPGEAFPGVTAAQVCTPGYSGRVRHVEPRQYVGVYAAYGVPYPQPSGSFELDHLIPLELGGDNADANLWPEAASPVPGFHQKDVLENRLHELVCSGRMALGDAQHAIASDWYAAYRTYAGG
ncbi:MAG: hypothetical protein QOG45_76 [Chloroflexota bacterium]|nr:hypothetical protein [Chloroflexota bacterium]